ncbi:hypothetical protein GCM10009647_061210 [Streptomyces sanglieri]
MDVPAVAPPCGAPFTFRRAGRCEPRMTGTAAGGGHGCGVRGDRRAVRPAHHAPDLRIPRTA